MRIELTREQRAAQRYLSRYRITRDRLASTCEFLQQCEINRDSIACSLTMGGGGGAIGADKMLNSIIKIESACTRIRDLVEKLESDFEASEALVTEVEQRDYDAGHCLHMVFMAGLDMTEIAEKLGTTRKTSYACLRRGLDMAYDLMEEDNGQ